MTFRLRVLGSKFKIGLITTGLAGTGYYYYLSKHADQQTGDSEDFVGQVGQTHAKKPILFKWSSLPNFIEKRFNPNWDSSNDRLWNLGSTIVVGTVGSVAKVFLKYLQYTRVYNLDRFIELVHDNRERGLITGRQ